MTSSSLRACASGIADTIGAGDEKVVGNDLDAISNRSGETGQAGLIIFRKRVLYRADRIAVEPANQHRGHRIGIEHAVFECKMIAAVPIEIRRGNVERDHNLLSREKSRVLDRANECFDGGFIRIECGPITPFVRHPLQPARITHHRARGAVHLGGALERLRKAAGPRRHDHNVLNIYPPSCVGAAAENLNFGERQHRLPIAEQIGIERPSLRSSGGMEDRHRYRHQRIAAEPAFIGRAVEHDQHVIDLGLRSRVAPM